MNFLSRPHTMSSKRKRTNSKRGLRFEALEIRRLLAADINGTIYDDVDSNGIKSPSDNTLGGWVAFVDIDQNGVLNSLPDGSSEPFAVANAGGDYAINMAGRPSGVYRVAEVVQAGWVPTAPAARDVSFTAGQSTNKIDFFNFAGGTIEGTVWNDVNQDKIRDTTDPGLEGWTVFLDINTNGSLDASEPSTVTDADGLYRFTDVPAGDYEVTEIQPAGWDTNTDIKQTATVQALQTVTQDFENFSTVNGSLSGTVWNDQDGNGDRASDPVTGLSLEPGLEGWTIFLDDNANGTLDATEISTTSDALGNYIFPSVLNGSHLVREILPSAKWSPAPGYAMQQFVNVLANENTNGVDFANFTVLNGAISGTVWNDVNRDGLRNSLLGAFVEPGLQGWTIFLDMNHSGAFDSGEPTTVTSADGSYLFSELQIGDYDLIEVVPSGWETAPGFGDNHTVKVYSGATSTAPDFANFNLSTLVPGFVSGSVWDDLNGNGVRETTPTAEPGSEGWTVFVDANGNRVADPAEPQASTTADGTFTINGVTPGSVTIVVQARSGWHATSPMTGTRSLTLKNGENASGISFGEQQTRNSSLTGTVFADLNKNGVRDAGERGFRAGSLPVILLATDTGFAYQPNGETSVTGLGGVTLPLSALTQTSRGTTPFGSGAGIQETITGLNALGALVIGLGTNPEATFDPRQGLESIAKLTGATNQSAVTIANGTADPVAPGDPLYFQIASGFASSVSTGVVNAIQNAVTNVAVNITVQASDPRVHIINHTGTLSHITSGQTAAFDIEFVGDGVPHRFDLQFVREGTIVVLGSIPVVLGTPVPGDGYHFDDLDDGEIELENHFGDTLDSALPPNVAPNFVGGADQIVAEDAGSQTVTPWATSISAGPASEASQLVNFVVTNDNASLFSVPPSISADGTLTFTSAPDANGTATITVALHDNGGTANSGHDKSAPQQFLITVTAVNDDPTGGVVITGAATQGQLLTVDVSSIADADGLGAFGYQWLRNGVPIVGAIDVTYLLSVEDVGTLLSVQVSFIDGYGTSEGPLTSLPTAPVADSTLSGTNFIVVDQSRDRTFAYDANGTPLENLRLNKEDKAPRGIASSSDSSTVWVVDAKGEVFIYDNHNRLRGSWEIKDVDKPEGITVHGNDLWIVDRGEDRVYFFRNGALQLSGKAEPTSSFRLNAANRNPRDLVTDGTHIWVVNDTNSADRVFRYTLGGSLEGSWRIDANNSKPTGITIDPHDVNHIWIVDSGTDSVYQYNSATVRITGQQSADDVFVLDSANRNPQGITAPSFTLGATRKDRELGLPSATDFSSHDTTQRRAYPVTSPGNSRGRDQSRELMMDSHKPDSLSSSGVKLAAAPEMRHPVTSPKLNAHNHRVASNDLAISELDFDGELLSSLANDLEKVLNKRS